MSSVRLDDLLEMRHILYVMITEKIKYYYTKSNVYANYYKHNYANRKC